MTTVTTAGPSSRTLAERRRATVRGMLVEVQTMIEYGPVASWHIIKLVCFVVTMLFFLLIFLMLSLGGREYHVPVKKTGGAQGHALNDKLVIGHEHVQHVLGALDIFDHLQGRV